MIRKILHRYFLRRNKSPIHSAIANGPNFKFIQKYNNWHIDKYGEFDYGPFYLKIFSYFLSWLDDWQITLRLRK